MNALRSLALVAAGVVTATACASSPPATPLSPPAALPDLRKAARPVPQPEHYWEPVEPDVRAAPKLLELPLADGTIVRIEGATRVWDQLGEAGRQRLAKDGLVVVPEDVIPSARQIGAFYTYARDQRLPYLVTLDALAFAVHVALERALAEVDEALLAPSLRALLAMLEARLGAEQKGASVEIGEGLRLARSVVGVANALARDTGAVVAADIAPIVATEVARVEAHAGPESSPLLGATIDYARLAAPEGAADPRAYRALAWLAGAPLVLLGRTEVPGATLEISSSRTHARAAMLLARAVDREIDPAIHDAWTKLARLLAFLWGPPDDLQPNELGDVAAAVDVRVVDPKHVADVARVDRVRKRAAKGRLPRVWNGSGAPGPAGLAVHLFAGAAPFDSVALSELAPATGGLPSALDVAAVGEARDARAAMREAGLDRADAYDAALARTIAKRPPPDAPARHASVYGSLLDVVLTWMAADSGVRRTIDSPAARRAAIESALATWTLARHDGQPLTRSHVSKTAPPTKELAIVGSPLPAFVEAAPDVIARLVAVAAQIRRGLVALRALPSASPALAMLSEVEDLLRIALRIATKTVNDEALAPEDLSALAALPARLARLDGSGAHAEGAPKRTIATNADVVVDRAKSRALVTATSIAEPLVTCVAEPGTGRIVMVVGAHLAHHEGVIDERAERARSPEDVPGGTPRNLAVGMATSRLPYTNAFRMVR